MRERGESEEQVFPRPSVPERICSFSIYYVLASAVSHGGGWRLFVPVGLAEGDRK